MILGVVSDGVERGDGVEGGGGQAAGQVGAGLVSKVCGGFLLVYYTN